MTKVRYPVYNKEIDVPLGTTLLEASQKAGIPHGSACGGVCACSTCHVYLPNGGNLVSEQEDDEADILDKAFDVRATSRLGCQCRIEKEGEIVVQITKESWETYYNEHPRERHELEAKGQLKFPGFE